MNKVLFYPDPPVQMTGHSLSKSIRYFQILGYKLTNDISSDWIIGVHWNYNDVNKIPEIFLDDNRPILNMRLTDVTKTNVDKVFTTVFGYSSLANTNSFGYCVRKTDRQSAHDGKIIRMPCKKEPGYVYQLLLDNRIAINMICDLRVPIFLGEIPLVFLKAKTIEGTFENTLSKKKKYWVDKPENYLSVQDIHNIQQFCKTIGLDIGELDTIRDNSTGNLYIIDVNNIPGGNVFDYLPNGKEVENDLAIFLQSLL